MRTVSRRAFVATAAIAAPALFMRRVSGAQSVTVEIANGRLQGLSENGIVSFRGIPYAADTGGRNRFMAPRPVPNWTGVRDASQASQGRGGRGRGAAAATQPASPAPASENYCVLSVYTPAVGDNARRPVLFWLGGTDPSALVKFGDVVVVTVSGRPGVLGYVHLGHLDPDFADAGNVGQLDIVAALSWVRSNIGAFGGDPGNVTPSGFSSGASQTGALLLQPGAKGLFHRYINFSGSSQYGVVAAASREPLTNEFLRVLGINQSNLRRLQELPIDQLQAAYTAAAQTLRFFAIIPVVDGRIIPHGPYEPQGVGLHGDVPVIVAMSGYEHASSSTNVSEDEVKARLKAQYSFDDAKAAAIMAGYRRENPKRAPWEVLAVATSEAWTRHSMRHGAELRANLRRAPVYFLDFNYSGAAANPIGALGHGADQSFAWGRRTEEPDAEVSRAYMSALVAFLRTGNPNNPRIPEWRPYDTVTWPTMVMDRPARLVNDWRSGDRQTSEMLPITTPYQVSNGPLARGV